MAIVSDIEIRLLANVAALQQNMNEARRIVSTGFEQMERAAEQFKNLLKTLGVGIGLRAIVNELVTAQREFDKLNSQLVTATGSVGNASRAFEALTDFAASTPYGLQDVTKAFIQLRNLGLTPSERALSSYGNTAAAMGKDLNQLIEAVADAATGEFERLKEFGVKSSKQGDSVAFTFQGVTTSVRNSSKEIEAYLMALGENQFAGGMERQAKTLDGAISNLGDTWQATLRTVNESGFGDVALSGVLALSNGLQDLQAILKATALGMREESGVAEESGFIHKALTTTFEALAVLAEQVAFTFRAVGGEIGGIAAQAAALLTGGGFAGAKAIREAMIADAEEDRRMTDARIEKILWAAKVQEKVRENEKAARAADKQDRLEGFAIQAKGAAQVSDAQKKQIDSYKSLLGAIREKIRESAAEAAGMQPLNDAQKMLIKLDEDMAAGKVKLTAAQEAAVRSRIAEYAANLDMIQSQKDFKAMADELAKADAARQAENKKLIDSARAEAEAQENLVLTFGMTKSAIAQMEVARLEEQLAQKESNNLTWEEIDTLKQLIFYKKRSAEATASGEVLDQQKEESKKAADEQIKFWESIDKTAHDTFVSIMDGGKNAAQRLKDTFKNVFFDWLYQQTLKKWIINLSGTASLSATGAQAAGAAGGGGGGSGMIGSAVTTALGAYFGAGGVGGALAAGAGWVTGASTLGGSLAAGTSLIGTGTLAGGLSGATMLVGTIAPIAIAAVVGSALLKKAFGRGPKETTGQGIQGTFGADSFSGNSFTEWIKKGGWFRSDKKGMDTSALSKETADSLNAAYKTIKDNTTAFATALGQPTDTITGYTKAIKLALTGDATKDQKILADLFAEMGDELATKVLPNVADFIQQGETAATTLQRLATEFQTVDAMLATLGLTSQKAFGAVGIASLEARDRLVRLAGGIDALGQQTTFFAENFMTEAERIAPVQKALNEQLSALGYAGLSTADQFKAAVLGIASSGELATEAGAKTYASLIALAPAFKAVSDYMDQAKAAADQLAQDQAQVARDSVAEAFSALQRSVEARKAGITSTFQGLMVDIETAIKRTSDRIASSSALSNALAGTRSNLAEGGTSRASGQAQILAALAIAKASGVLPTADSLQSALQAVAQDSQDQFKSFVDYKRDALLTQNSIEELSGITDADLSVAERQLALLESQKLSTQDAYDAQIALLDGMLSSAQLQLDAINGVNVSILGLHEALKAFNSAASAAFTNPTVAAGPSAAEGKIEALYQSVFGRKSDSGGLAYYSNLLRNGTSLSDIEAGLRNSNEYRSQVYQPQQSGTMQGSSAAFEARMDSLNAAMTATANATTKLAYQFDQVSGGGNSLMTEIN